ncbi:MAG: cyclic nucleotide-binding domain-containing protein [Chloroflexota bacterium]
MLSTIEKVLHLKSVSIFTQVPDHLLADVAGLVQTINILPNTHIFQKGDPGSAMYIIVSGSVKIEDNGFVVDTLEEGAVFGEMALLDGGPRSASAIAAEETLLLQLSKEEFHELLSDHGEITLGIIYVLSQRLRARTQELSDLKIAKPNNDDL